VGCCGFSAGKGEYFERFRTVEVQETFYRLPRTATAARWRQEAPPDFTFCMKAWQVITHPHTSPTWRRSGLEVPPQKAPRYGLLQPTRENFKAWDETLLVAKAMSARVCVLQCPPSFRFTSRAMKNVREFLGGIDRGGMAIGWEPRGEWHGHRREIKRICDRLDVVHVVDLLREEPATFPSLLYTRLHGLGGREVNYKYRYTQEDLITLKARTLAHEGAAEVFVMFNNISMGEDAQRFKAILSE